MSASDSKPAGAPRLSDAQVRAYLKRHPTFFQDNADLLAVLAPPGRDRGNVVDLQRAMVERLQREVSRLGSYQSELLTLNQANQATQAQVHAAVLALVEAQSFAHLIDTVTGTLPGLLDIDVATICVERGGSSPKQVKTEGVFVIPSGRVNALLGPEREILLRPESAGPEGGEPALFGAKAAEVRSDALVRLKPSSAAPAGLLALGSREPEKFHPGQGTELLGFLARVLDRCIRGWLDLPR
jgi:uncharacterized protein YigA (DUF484 family)